MLKSKTKVVFLDQFYRRTEDFIVKDIGSCTEDCLDCVSFLSPTSYSELTTHQKQSLIWLTRYLHGIEWNRGNYPYCFLTQTVHSVRLLNMGALFYAKGEMKVKFLSELLECSIIDLNSLECPSKFGNSFKQNCRNRSKGKKTFQRRGIDKKGGTPVTEFNSMCLDYGDGNLSLSISKDETIKTGKQFFTEKSSIVTDRGRNLLIHLFSILYRIFSSREKVDC